MRLRNLRTVVPDGIRNGGVIKAFLGGGGNTLVEKEVSPFGASELARLGTYIVQQEAAQDRPAAPPPRTTTRKRLPSNTGWATKARRCRTPRSAQATNFIIFQ